MPNKYNFRPFNIEFIPGKVKTSLNKVVLNIDNEQKKEPVMQIADENDTQILYYLDNILLYKINSINFFVICLTSDKNPETYIVFDVAGGGSTHDGTSIAKIMAGLGNEATQNQKQTVSLDFNADMRSRTFLRTGNVFYAGNITTTRVFPTVSPVSPANLPAELKELTGVPIGADPMVFVQEEIQWVLDCNQIGEYGKETPIMETKNPYADIIVGVIAGMIGIVGIYLFYEFLKLKDPRTTLIGPSPEPFGSKLIQTIQTWITNIRSFFSKGAPVAPNP